MNTKIEKGNIEQRYKLTIEDKEITVKWDDRMSLEILLDIFGISIHQQDFVRAFLAENDMIFFDDKLLLVGKKIIPTGMVVRMAKRLISTEKLRELDPNDTTRSVGVSYSKKTTNLKQKTRNKLLLLIQENSITYAIYGGCSIIAIMVGAGIASILMTINPSEKYSEITPERMIIRKRSIVGKNEPIGENKSSMGKSEVPILPGKVQEIQTIHTPLEGDNNVSKSENTNKDYKQVITSSHTIGRDLAKIIQEFNTRK